MHPTADTIALMLRESLGAAGDAGRYALLYKVKPHSSKRALLNRIEQAGRSLGGLTPSEGVDLMTGFYVEERAEGCSVAIDGDMLLYQWGTYDWGGGESFEFDITRQLIVGGGEDDNIFQLSLTFQFQPTAALRHLGSGDRWCQSPDVLEGFRAFIHSSAPFLAAGHEAAANVNLEYDVAG